MNYPVKNEVLLSLTEVFELEFLLYDHWHCDPPAMDFLVNAYLGKRQVMFRLPDRRWMKARTGNTKEEAERRLADEISSRGALVADAITLERLFHIPSFSTVEELRMKAKISGLSD